MHMNTDELRKILLLIGWLREGAHIDDVASLITNTESSAPQKAERTLSGKDPV